jgi:oxygen-dependent protoporphyrinogen oxidase
MIGGRMDPTAVEESDADVEAQVLDELGWVIGLSGSPTLVHHTNWRVGIPQYELGHLDRWSSIRARVEQIAGLELCGNAYDGVSVNDCIRYGRSVGRKLAAAVRTD